MSPSAISVDFTREPDLRIRVAPMSSFRWLVYIQSDHYEISLYLSPARAKEIVERASVWLDTRVQAPGPE